LNSGKISANAVYNNHHEIKDNIINLFSSNLEAKGKVRSAQNIQPKAAINEYLSALWFII
jgi:hypothetical protein